MAIVECVPNFSEGRDINVINKITAEIEKTKGVELLDVDPGEATNRTVVTFAGDPDAAIEAAFKAIQRAAELIDMRGHHGAHPRFGATDVCPFVPVSGISIEECVAIAHKLAKRVGDELGIPIYLYEYAATKPERRNLAYCRQGEYEGLSSRVGNSKWTPDFGPDTFNAKSGATAISARDFLIAWNVNLNTRSTKIASKIANRLRERGYAKMTAPGTYARDDDGKVIMLPGKFKGVKAVGWYIDEYQRAQVSINITNLKLSPLHEIFDEACDLAEKFGARVTGSELVGLIPLDAILEAGKHYMEKQSVITGVSEAQLVHTAELSLGLNEVAKFDPQEKIIEYRLRKPGLLTSMKITDFIDELASGSPAPGGGSVAALCGALSAGLASMVANLTFDKKGYKKFNDEMNDVAVRAQKLKAKMIDLVDKDTEAFNEVMAAFGLPKKTSDEQFLRTSAINKANQGAAQIPFEVVRLMPEVVKLAGMVAEHGNRNLTPDAGVAGLIAMTAVRGAAYNVMVNLQSLPEDDFSENLKQETNKILDNVDAEALQIKKAIEKRLWE